MTLAWVILLILLVICCIAGICAGHVIRLACRIIFAASRRCGRVKSD